MRCFCASSPRRGSGASAWRRRSAASATRARRGDVSPRRERARGGARNRARFARQLEVLKYRSLARGTTKLLERRARRAMAAFRLCVRAASRERRVERELVPKWNRVIRKRLAFKRDGPAPSSPAAKRASRRARSRWPPSCGSPGGSHARGSRRRARAARSGARAARAKATFAARRARRRVGETFDAWASAGPTPVARRRDAEPRFCTPGTSGGGTSRYLSRRGATRRFANQRRRRTPPSWLRARPVRACIGSRGGAAATENNSSSRVASDGARTSAASRRGRARAGDGVRRARGAQLVRAWHVAKRASKHAKRVLFSRAFGAWEASARERRFAETSGARRAKQSAPRVQRRVRGVRRVSRHRVWSQTRRRALSPRKRKPRRRVASRTARTVPPRRTARRGFRRRADGVARRFSGVGGAPRGRARAHRRGCLLETPLGWRGVQTANASVVAEMGTSAHLGGAKQTRGGEAATNPDEKSVGVSKPLDPCPPVFIPDRDPYALDATEDGAPSTSGVVVTLLPGGKIVTFAALAVSTPSATTRRDLDPAAKWLAAETEAVAGAAPRRARAPRCARSRRRPRRWPPRPPARTPPAWSAASSCTAASTGPPR